jgi:hypothetical protein
MKNIRLLHRYMGLFFSPAILFFAFSGALQTFNLHKPNKTTGYVPPTWILELAQIHKDQSVVMPKEKAKTTPDDSDNVEKSAPKKTPKHEQSKSTLPLKCFVLVMSIGLMASTLLGIYMAFRYGGDWRLVWGMLIAGTVLPIAIMLL